MGVACQREGERGLAALGRLAGADVVFDQPVLAVRHGGVLTALPALLVAGLLRHNRLLARAKSAFYSLESVLLMLAFMALCRIRSPEALSRTAPAEWGLLLGLDRGPHPRTLRGHVSRMARDAEVGRWFRALSADWLAELGGRDGVLYVDGHVRVYHGSQVNLPSKWLSRDRLCMSGMTDYWVNDEAGRPVFVVSKSVTQGMIDTLRRDIVPRLLAELPPGIRPFLVFDREGFSPAFLQEMRDIKVHCVTYRKNVKDKWPDSEFRETTVGFPCGRREKMRLARRAVSLSNGMPVTEVRRLCDSGHQTALVDTSPEPVADESAGRLFNRWTQENFFKYMMAQYGIDRLVEYGGESLPDTTRVPNPRRKELQNLRRGLQAKLDKARPLYRDLDLRGDDEMPDFIAAKARLHETITGLISRIATVKQEIAGCPTHVPIGALPPDERPEILLPRRKAFSDQIKMIAYRAETAMANLWRPRLPPSARDDVRSALQDLFTRDADLLPDPTSRRLNIRIHAGAAVNRDRWLQQLLDELNQTETRYPGTNLRLYYQLVTAQLP